MSEETLRPAWSQHFTPDAIQELLAHGPFAKITPDWAWGNSTGRGVRVAIVAISTARPCLSVTISASALAGGEIQFDVVAPQPHIAASLSGADIIIIGTYFNKHTYSIVARPGIRSPQELKGKKIGVLSVVGLNAIVVNTALKHWRMDEKSVTLVRAGGSRDRLAALQSGLIDAFNSSDNSVCAPMTTTRLAAVTPLVTNQPLSTG